jgi:hypothetical protein
VVSLRAEAAILEARGDIEGMREEKVMAKKRSKQWAWQLSPAASHPAMSAAVKAEVEAKARKFVEEVLKPKFVQPPPKEPRLNYVTDVTLKWHGSTLFFIKVYTCPGPNALTPSFEDRFARMRPAGKDRFDLSFMRHTGQWVELYQGQTVEECLETIRDDPWFQV